METINGVMQTLESTMSMLASISAIAKQAIDSTRNGFKVDDLVYGIECLTEQCYDSVMTSLDGVAEIKRSVSSASSLLNEGSAKV